MARDRSSSIQETRVKDDASFFEIRCAYPDPVEESVIKGFQILDPNHRKDVKAAFALVLSRVTHLSKPPTFRKNDIGWICKVRFGSKNIAEKFHKSWNFQVNNIVKNRGGKEIERIENFSAKPTVLKEVLQRENLLERIIDGDDTIFDMTPDKIRVLKTAEISVYYAVDKENTVFVLFRRRQTKDHGKVTQSHDTFWNFYTVEDNEISESFELKDVDPNDRGAIITLHRMLGKDFGLSDFRDECYRRNISAIHKPINPSSPPRNVAKESADLNKFGKNCEPVQIQAFTFAKNIGITSDDVNERKFWENTTIVDRLRDEYKKKFETTGGTGFRGRKKKEQRVIRLKDLIDDRQDLPSRN